MDKFGILSLILLFITFFEALLSMGLISHFINVMKIDEEKRYKYLYPNFYNSRNGLLVMDLVYMAISVIGFIGIFINKKKVLDIIFYVMCVTIIVRGIMSLIFLIDPNENWVSVALNNYYYYVIQNGTLDKDLKNQLTAARNMYLNEIAAFVMLSVLGGASSFLLYKNSKNIEEDLI